jgi:hypothetical protein
MRLEGLGQLKESNELIGYRTRERPACSVGPHRGKIQHITLPSGVGNGVVIPLFCARNILAISLLSFPGPAQTAALTAMLVILFLSSIGSLLSCVGANGCWRSFCRTGEPTGTDLLSSVPLPFPARCSACHLLSYWFLTWLIFRP